MKAKPLRKRPMERTGYYIIVMETGLGQRVIIDPAPLVNVRFQRGTPLRREQVRRVAHKFAERGSPAAIYKLIEYHQ